MLERTKAYLDTLPQGLQSYPECVMRGDSFDYMRETHPEIAKESGLPEPVQRYLNAPPPDWMPEALGNAIYLILRELGFESDDAFLEWARASSHYHFSKPWARVLMFVMSPTLVIMGAAKRWNAFHQGTTLRADPAIRDGGRIHVVGTLSYPDRLYPRLVLDLFAKSFEVAVTSAGAKNAEATLDKDESDTETRYFLTWDA